MKIETLKEFITLVRCGSFNRAARELFIAQSSLSTHIATMEHELGFKVVTRSEQGITPTPAGTRFLGFAQDIVDTYQEAKSICTELAHRRLPIRMKSISPKSELFKRIAELHEFDIAYVDVDFGMSTPMALERGLIDIGVDNDLGLLPGIGENLKAAGIVSMPLGEAPCSIVMMRTNPLASKTALTHADLESKSISIGGTAYFEEQRQSVLRLLGSDLHLRFVVAGSRSKADVASGNLGDALHVCGAEANAELYAGRNDVVSFDAVDGKPLHIPSAALYRQDNDNPDIEKFAYALRDIVSGME